MAVLTDWQARDVLHAFRLHRPRGVDTERRHPRVTFWRIKVKSIRRYGFLDVLLACLTAAGMGLSACGGQGEQVRSPAPAPAKVAWDNPDSQTAPETKPSTAAEEATESEDAPAASAGGGGVVIDLDAKPTPSEPKADTKADSKVRAKPVAVAAAASAEPAEDEAADEEPSRAEASPPAEPESPASDPLAAELRKRRAQAKARSDSKSDSNGDAKSDEAANRKRVAAAAPAKPDYGGSDPCRATSFSLSRVRDACATGGRTGAKRVMKEAIGKATATGQLLKCSNCHENQSEYTLRSNAAADLQRWLGD
jgi:hypothetical protein